MSSEADRTYWRRPVVWIVVVLVLLFVVVPTLIWVLSNTLAAD